MKPSLLNALRKGTAVAIGIDSYSIALVPHPHTTKPGGVYDSPAGTPRPAQSFAIESVGNSGAATKTEGAQVLQWHYELVGKWDCAMEIGDTWDDADTQYRIVAILPSNGYERRGAVVAIGRHPAYGT